LVFFPWRTMNLAWLAMMISAASMNFAMAWSLWKLLGPVAFSPGLVFLRQVFPDQIWPMWFFLCGLFAVGGIVSATAARMHFVSGAVVLAIWTVATFSLWAERGPQPGAFLLSHLVVLKLVCAYYVNRLRRISRATERLAAEMGVAQDQDHYNDRDERC
jgi:hypothetical protein